jgi:hypothetical protein
MGGDMGDFPSSNDLKKVDRTSFSPHILGNDGGQPSDKPFPIELFFCFFNGFKSPIWDDV